MDRRCRAGSLVALLVLCSGSAASAVTRDQWQVGPQVLVSVPLQDFENVSGVGGGLGVKGVLELSPRFGLRGDAAYLSYGRSIVPLFVDETFGAVFGETLHQSFRFGLGSQVSLPVRRNLGLYGGAQAGLYYFRTSVTVFSAFGSDSDTIDENVALGWGAGLGALLDVGLGPWIDLAVEHHTMYDLPGLPREDPADPGAPLVDGPEIDAGELLVRLGVTFLLEGEDAEENVPDDEARPMRPRR